MGRHRHKHRHGQEHGQGHGQGHVQRHGYTHVQSIRDQQGHGLEHPHGGRTDPDFNPKTPWLSILHISPGRVSCFFYTTDAPRPHLYILPDPPVHGNLYAILR